MRLRHLSVVFALLSASIAARADSVAFINFDDRPQGPSYFASAGPAQTITYPSATFQGGVILGLASAFPANIYATNPNQYGTASFGDSSLLSTITISIDPSFATKEVSFALFNGETSPASYSVSAYNGVALVASQLFNNISANTNSGYVLPDLLAANITSVQISALDKANFDFVIDDVSLNQSVQQGIAVTPEPSSLLMLGTGMVGMLAAVRRRLA